MWCLTTLQTKINVDVDVKWAKRRWCGWVNIHFMQMSLVMSMQFIFGDDWSDTPSWSRFTENDLKSKHPEDYSTVDKKGMKDLQQGNPV